MKEKNTILSRGVQPQKTSAKKTKFFADAKKTLLPFVCLPIDAKRAVVMLIDTGSTENILFGYAYEALKDVFKETEVMHSVVGIEGSQTAYRTVEGGLIVAGKEFRSIFTLQDNDRAGKMLSQEMGFPVGGIIGTSFMVEHGWILDFANQELIVPNNCDGVSLEVKVACPSD